MQDSSGVVIKYPLNKYIQNILYNILFTKIKFHTNLNFDKYHIPIER